MMKRTAFRLPKTIAAKLRSNQRQREVPWQVSSGVTSMLTLSFSCIINTDHQCRHFSKSKSPKRNGNVTLEDHEDEDFEPNEASHPESTLKGNRDMFTVPVTIRMPDMGEGNNNILEEWYKEPGDIIKRNDVLCDITTPDFTFGMVTDDEHDSIMGEILVEKGQEAPDDAPICIVYHPEDGGKSKKKDED